MGSRSMGWRRMGMSSERMYAVRSAPCVRTPLHLGEMRPQLRSTGFQPVCAITAHSPETASPVTPILASSQYAQNIACMQVLKLETYSQFTYHCSHHNLCYLAPQAQPPRYSASSAVNPRRRHPENFQTGICFLTIDC